MTEHLSDLKKLAGYLTRNSEDAAELLQDTMVKVCERGVTSLPLARAVMRNTWYDTLRRRRRMPDMESIELHEPHMDVAAHDEAWSVLDGLSERQALALRLRYMEGLSHAEIAEQLGCAPTTVRTLIRRAKRRARQASDSFAPT